MTPIAREPIELAGLPGATHVAWFWDVTARQGKPASAADLAAADLAAHISQGASSFYIELTSAGSLAASLQYSVFNGATLGQVRRESSDRVVTGFRSRCGLALDAVFMLDHTEDQRIADIVLRLRGGASTTAVLLAAVRAAHFAADEPKILSDPLAGKLAGEFAEGFIARVRGDPTALPTRFMAVARSRWAEDTLIEARTEGVDQYVLLGAGLDSFAYRRPDPDDGLEVFEVDHPSTQAWKRQRLADVGLEIPSSVRYVPVDFERQDLSDELQRAGFDPGRPAVVAWLGVADYLTTAALGATLDRIASWASGTRLVLDYDLPPEYWDSYEGWDGDIMRGLASWVARLGEPWISHYTPREMETLLRDHGYAAVEHMDHHAVRSRYMQGCPADAPGPHPWQRLVRTTVVSRPT
jgi:methyltransferase (TIGR00027 family)